LAVLDGERGKHSHDGASHHRFSPSIVCFFATGSRTVAGVFGETFHISSQGTPLRIIEAWTVVVGMVEKYDLMRQISELPKWWV
jgi:hypothetical protein